MSEGAIIVLAALVVVWSLTSARLERIGLSGPMLFLAAGLVCADQRFAGIRVGLDTTTVHSIAELTLALVLFSDAAGVSLRRLRAEFSWPGRLLFLALPLSVLLGAGLAMGVLRDLPWEAAALVAAALVATDAALSAGLIADRHLPERVRLTINVESGLNDGLATPVVVMLIAATASAIGMTERHDLTQRPGAAIVALAIGIAFGVGAGWLGGVLVTRAHAAGWTGEGGRQLAAFALAILLYAAMVAVGANGFVAAFVGGLSFGATLRQAEAEVIEYPSLIGDVMAWTTWFIFGAALVLPALEHAGLAVVVYAVLSLTVVRMAPVALSLLGTTADRPTMAFLGWFGPRGLASVVFALLIAEELPTSDTVVQTVLATIVMTVLLSVVLHGATQTILSRRLARAEGTATA